MTNISDLHTCAVGSMNLVTAVVLVAHSQAFQLACNMISSAGVHIPVRIYTVRTRGRRGCTFLRWTVVVGVEPLEAAMSRMPLLATNLAVDAWLEVAAMAAPPIVVATTTAASTATAKTPTTTATTVGVVGGGTGVAVLGGRVGGVATGRRVEPLALLMSNELRIKL